jgi:hypothetical protein
MKLFGLNKLSREKRNQLLVVVVLTIVVLAGLGFGLVKYQYGVLAELAQKKIEANQKLEQMRNIVKHAPEAATELEATSKVLAAQEANMASRDAYLWFITTLRKFKQAYHVEIPQVGQPVQADMNLLAKFPYKQVTLSLAGTARFHELGRFVADLENQFPHMRILNLDLEPSSAGSERETLGFRMDIVMLVNPNPS